MKKLICIAVILTILGLSAQAEESKPRQVTVTGKSSIKVDPDKATMRFAIINKENDAEKARQKNELTAKKVLNSVRDLGVDEKQMQLESMQITEEKKYDTKTRTYNFDGYKATRVFVVELHKLDLLAGVIAAVVSNGSNELSNVEYGLQDPATVKKQALKNAMVNAMEKTDLILSPLVSKRGELITVDELSNDFINYPRPNYKSVRMMAMAADAPMAEEDAFAQGQIEVEASIRTVFAIAD
ncbi:MAG: SIMPL domain-containing protein [Cyanobacteria bacterium]|nr:SIMPL domain-containing protein [Cyanobacteriota bacterium]MDA1020925.1 SIMPL domain-containing protein [Cyanobacteriota bacterium]